jgi:hypothetical protein
MNVDIIVLLVSAFRHGGSLAPFQFEDEWQWGLGCLREGANAEMRSAALERKDARAACWSK